jgi:hypothetical protein
MQSREDKVRSKSQLTMSLNLWPGVPGLEACLLGGKDIAFRVSSRVYCTRRK